MKPAPRFCSACGAPLVERLIPADSRIRLACSSCGIVAYCNPQVLVTALVSVEGQVLLCRRAQPPAKGRWVLPGGFIECKETLGEAAVRETLEETGIRLDVSELRLHTLSSLPDIGEIYVGLRISLAQQQSIVIGSECEDVRYFSEAELPWAELAYPDIGNYLRLFFREQRRNEYAVHFSRLDAAGAVRNSYRVADDEAIRFVRCDGVLVALLDSDDR
ncbi:MAG: hydrolase [Hydrocarboniphaga sp.]|uniref:NUDIX hydrolase n=1 Tax=Hydrocarboniphaga sp. TaxID=2033016 RepID=UPI00260FDE56|nr:NUDIX hydrolase [Hydrocarboniphaga sp.]MDB5970353.1 hydrolase [Hydrocarboniphaga sp.]